MPKRNKNQGFTLIELLVVISVLGVMAALILVATNTARGKARDARRRNDISSVQKALEFYYDRYNVYPASGGSTVPNAGWSVSNNSSWNSVTNSIKPYIALPHDPKEVGSGWTGDADVYAYSYFSDPSNFYGCGANKWYILVYKLEFASGPDPGMKVPCGNITFQYGGSGGRTAIKTLGNK